VRELPRRLEAFDLALALWRNQPEPLVAQRVDGDLTDATIDLLPVLRDELAALKASAKPHSHERVFPTQAGGPLNQSNVRNRTLALSVERANNRLEAAGSVPLPEGLTPHKLRHTFASLLVALGTDPGAVMDQLGHEDAAFTLRVYRHGMRRDERSKQALGQVVGVEKAAEAKGAGGRCSKNLDGPAWTRTRDLPIMSRQL
jgi:integrase